VTAWLAAHLGYGVLFVWSLLEGEIGLILGGYLSREGTLQLGYVVAIAFSGALISDTTLYFIGRHYRMRALKRILRDIRKAYAVRRWLLRYGGWVIVFDRFIYGTHIPAMLTVGMVRYPLWRFMVLEIVGVALWSVTFTMLGFFFGKEVVNIIQAVQHNLLLAVVGTLIIVLLWKTKQNISH
jgi:membrane protein DedA with SNARE-associated domain